jgi:hypothetical protein
MKAKVMTKAIVGNFDFLWEGHTTKPMGAIGLAQQCEGINRTFN